MRKILILILLALILTACNSVKYIPIETVRTDSIYITKTAVDTFIRNDSVFIEYKGDTVVVEKYRFIYKTREKTDTVCVERTDTLQVPYPVEKQLTKWQQAKMDLGGIAFAMLFIALAIAVVWLIKKYRK